MELLFLGTGAGVPSKERNVTAIALMLLQEINSIWLFDCGEATQHQILHTSIKPRKVNKIFITHLHGDHIFGLPGFLSSRSFQGGEDELIIYGPKGIEEYVRTSLELSGSHLTYPLSFVELSEGIIVEEEGFIVSCKKLDHGIPSYGFRIEEINKPGELQVEKLKSDGINPGPVYSLIKENETTTLEDGRMIHRKDYIGPDKPGRHIVILGDTRSTELNQDFVQAADLLVHEATFDKESYELAHNYYHSTTAQAADLAKAGKVKKLVLTHVSSRYQKQDLDQLLDEARAIFPNTEIAHDFFKLSVPSH
ncbi:ribonuclease Z [Ornithinibacillus massiliensis]|uniref:Ribonuclease Z n=1 Tax=Ornithinibacillus massiliensis TaxID=1944633 RepID=A0ABS5MBE5_9BACI|nr:ribonuclease Z [Ornithinibacillus massiliensis]MBS3679647.1 ribonuclease Z [Ornithinibacillus massiliensis]